MTPKKPALGKGLGALIEDAHDLQRRSTAALSFEEVDISLIDTNPFQPRTVFEEDALQELSASIAAMGVIQPVTLRRTEAGRYQIIAGERRFRASKMAGLDKVPAYIRTVEDDAMLEMALVENIQREDLDAIEVALSYQKLMEDYSLTQDQLSEKVGKKRATVANYVRLLKLPSEIQLGIRDKKIQMGHAKALLGIADVSTQLMVYEQILEFDFSVRKVEEIVHEIADDNYTMMQPVAKEKRQSMEPEYKDLQKQLSAFFGSKIALKRNDNGEGKITIPFKSDEDFERLITLFDKLR